ncbi:MAG: hypothetical protein K2K11_06600, partial [Bacteroidales bacterium]|nr:hypothetical protein [Bacteroidales bacterium]
FLSAHRQKRVFYGFFLWLSTDLFYKKYRFADVSKMITKPPPHKVGKSVLVGGRLLGLARVFSLVD